MSTDDALINLLTITGVDATTGAFYLESAGGSLELAVQLWAGGGNGNSFSSSSSFVSSSSSSSSSTRSSPAVQVKTTGSIATSIDFSKEFDDDDDDALMAMPLESPPQKNQRLRLRQMKSLTIFCREHAGLSFLPPRDIIITTNSVSTFWRTCGLATIASSPLILTLTSKNKTLSQAFLRLFTRCKIDLAREHLAWKYPFIQLPSGTIQLPELRGGDRQLFIKKDVKLVGATDQKTKLLGCVHIHGANAKNCLLKNVTIHNRTGSGIKIDTEASVTLTKVQVESCCLSGLHIVGASVNLVECSFWKNGKHGICLRQGSKCYLLNTKVQRNRSDGIIAYDQGTEIHVQIPDQKNTGGVVNASDASDASTTSTATTTTSTATTTTSTATTTTSMATTTTTTREKANIAENSGAGVKALKNSMLVVHGSLQMEKLFTSNPTQFSHELTSLARDNQGQNVADSGNRMFSPMPLDGVGVGIKRQRSEK